MSPKRKSKIISSSLAEAMISTGVTAQRIYEVLKADSTEEAQELITAWDEFQDKEHLTPEAVAEKAGYPARRMWEIFCGASMDQARWTISALVSEKVPVLLKMALEDAEKHPEVASALVLKLLKAVPMGQMGTGPAPRGFQAALPEGNSPEGDLEPADGLLIEASKLMKAVN